MRCCRLLLLPLLAGLTVLIAGALTLQTANSSVVTAPPPSLPLRADAGASQMLAQAMEKLAPAHVRWIQAQVWQKVDVPALAFQAEGLYQAGPDHRLRLDMRVRSEATTSRLLLVSDGQTLWQARQVAGDMAAVTHLKLKKVLEVIDRPEGSAAREEFYQSQFFAGPLLLLQILQEQVTFTRLDRVCWRQRDVHLLAGARGDSPGNDWPMYRPRQCRLFLDARSLWPCRIEWWGPAPKQAGDVLLSQMEFREPVLNQPVPTGQFIFQPDTTAGTDVTDRWTVVTPQ